MYGKCTSMATSYLPCITTPVRVTLARTMLIEFTFSSYIVIVTHIDITFISILIRLQRVILNNIMNAEISITRVGENDAYDKFNVNKISKLTFTVYCAGKLVKSMNMTHPFRGYEL